MKKLFIFAFLLVVPPSLIAQNEASAPSHVEYSPLELLEAWGWFLGQQYTLDRLELTDEELAAISRGISTFAKGDRSAIDIETAARQLQRYMEDRLDRVREERIETNKRKEHSFMDSLIGVPNIRSLATGLFFEIIEPGSGRKPATTDRVSVHYTGAFIDGKVFDSSYERNAPMTFKLDEVIRAWTEGLPLIGVGGKIKLYVPAELAYGDEGQPGIPPASTLIFEIELLEILDEEAQPMAPSLTVE